MPAAVMIQFHMGSQTPQKLRTVINDRAHRLLQSPNLQA